MKCQKTSDANKLILGAILGGVVVGTSAVFLSTKKGQKLKDNAADKLQDVKDQLQEFLGSLSDKKEGFVSCLSDQAEGCSEKLQDFTSQVKDLIDTYSTDENKDRLSTLLIGTIIGGMLGAGASAYLNSDTAEKGDMFKNLGSKASSLKSTISDILHVLEDKTGVHVHSNGQSNTIKDIMDFATSGVQIWQKFQKK